MPIPTSLCSKVKAYVLSGVRVESWKSLGQLLIVVPVATLMIL